MSFLGLGPATAVALSAVCACSDPYDPSNGELAIVIGFQPGGSFVALEAGEPCPIIDAVQGGYWVMPTLRMSGVDRMAFLDCSVVDLVTDRVIAAQTSTRELGVSEDGTWFESLYFFPAQALTTRDAYIEVDGRAGKFSCTASDDKVAATTEVDVVLTTASL